MKVQLPNGEIKGLSCIDMISGYDMADYMVTANHACEEIFPGLYRMDDASFTRWSEYLDKAQAANYTYYACLSILSQEDGEKLVKSISGLLPSSDWPDKVVEVCRDHMEEYDDWLDSIQE